MREKQFGFRQDETVPPRLTTGTGVVRHRGVVLALDCVDGKGFFFFFFLLVTFLSLVHTVSYCGTCVYGRIALHRFIRRSERWGCCNIVVILSLGECDGHEAYCVRIKLIRSLGLLVRISWGLKLSCVIVGR